LAYVACTVTYQIVHRKKHINVAEYSDWGSRMLKAKKLSSPRELRSLLDSSRST